ncbi:MAG: hypothetical protein ABJG42_24275 [Vibrio splendidus]
MTAQKSLRLNLKTVETQVAERNEKLSEIVNHSITLQENETHASAVKQLHDKAHNATARQKRLNKFLKTSKECQKYVFKNCKDHEASILSTSSIYAFDTLLSFVQNITDSKVVNRECFYVFFEAFTKSATVSAKQLQRAMMMKCTSQRTKDNYTAESARTWTRNSFHAMHALGAMTEQKISNEIFYTIDSESQVVKDLMSKTALLPTCAVSETKDDIEIDETDLERA